MGHKKRNPETQTHKSDPSTDLALKVTNSSYTSIKSECERALTSLRRGNHTKALRLLKDLCSRNENSPFSALIHRVQATVCVKVASIIDDPNVKQPHLRNAVESARKAVSLSPNSVEFSHFYANLLFEAAKTGKDYEEVVGECERALAIENPVDPAKESFQEDVVGTVEERVGNVCNEIRNLIQKANIASISVWMKKLGNVDDNIRFIPLTRVVEKPNEVKKPTKTDEERRKEIEVRVAAARVLQHKLESDDSSGNSANNSSNSRTKGGGERRKSGNVRKNVLSGERKDLVRMYWNSMSLDRKKGLLKINVLDLKAHFSKAKDGLLKEVINEALSFGEANGDWKFWVCCSCNAKFSKVGSFMNHVVHVHMDSLLTRMQSILPEIVDEEWAERILNCPWKPLDLNASIRIFEKQSKLETHDFHDDPKECFVDTDCSQYECNSSPEWKKSINYCDDDSIYHDSKEFEDAEWIDCYGDQNNKAILFNDNWPLSDDPERAKLLEKIHSVMLTLIKHKYLASSHVSKVLQYALDELQGLARGSQLLIPNLEETPICICFLGALELKKILKFLQEISQSCGLSRCSNKSNASDDSNIGLNGVEVMEKIFFSHDSSVLVLDEQFLPCKAAYPSCYDANNGDIELDSDALLSWIYMGSSLDEHLASWMHMREDKAQQALEISELLEKESYNLKGLCERKCEHLNYEEALQAVEYLCLDEGKRREEAADFIQPSYETVLKKRREELIEKDVSPISKRFELQAISNVLKESETLLANQFSIMETYSGVTSHLCDIESGENDWRANDYLHQVDSCVEVAVQRQKELVSVEISKLDAKLMREVMGMQQLEVKLESASSHDYRSVVIPLVKSLLRACLEDLAEKDATERSDAAREAFLAELALDNSKHGHERTKDKKKSKESRKNKDAKVAIDCETRDQNTNELLLPCHNDEEVQGPEIDALVANNDALRLQEDERKHRMKLEAEERKLEETLEYQRRIESEAKQKHLADLHNKISKTSGKKAELVLPSDDFNVAHKDDNIDAIEQLARRKKYGLDNNMEGMVENAASGAVQGTGLTTGGISQDGGGLFSDRRSGRRGRRHKGPAKLIDGDYQSATSEKQDSYSAQPFLGQNAPGDCAKDCEGNAKDWGECEKTDNGAKTLRQLKAENDDEERFQADLKQAVLQSLEMPRKELPETNDSRLLCDGIIEGGNGNDTYGTGLKNEVGEYNCFLNVIIQSLWHLRRFRSEFSQKTSSKHFHVGDPCVVCALYEIFIALSASPTDSPREAIAPTSLRVALSNLYPESNFFQEGQMNDASEVLGVIFDCLHKSCTPAPIVSITDSVDNICSGSWDCDNGSCIAHSTFGMDVFEKMNCDNCGLESRHLKYTSFFHNINASALRTKKVMCPENSFDELLNLVEMNHQLACDTEAGGCGKLNYINHILSTPPHVFTTVLGWQNTHESVEDIKATLGALSTDIDASVLYRGLDAQNCHHLVSVVCYYGQHYHCFAYGRDHEQWIMYDDKTVKLVGSWNDVLSMCERGHLQPQVLLFEAGN